MVAVGFPQKKAGKRDETPVERKKKELQPFDFDYVEFAGRERKEGNGVVPPLLSKTHFFKIDVGVIFFWERGYFFPCSVEQTLYKACVCAVSSDCRRGRITVSDMRKE